MNRTRLTSLLLMERTRRGRGRESRGKDRMGRRIDRYIIQTDADLLSELQVDLRPNDPSSFTPTSIATCTQFSS